MAPRIGSDESGKGDYFGPLTAAAVFVDATSEPRLCELGVRDSKRLKDARVRELAPQIRAAVGPAAHRVVCVEPPEYNVIRGSLEREGAGRRLNWLLAWAHARCIEDILGSGVRPDFALVDQFAAPWYLERRLMARTRERGFEILQRPKAEADLAVAAASILARERFLDGLQKASARAGRELPKGAGPAVQRAANEIAWAGGRRELARIAKLHFRTTERALASLHGEVGRPSPAAVRGGRP